MEIIGLISSIIGLVTAVIKRKRIVELRYSYSGGDSSTSPVTVGKRLKRCIMLIVTGFVGLVVLSELGVSDNVLRVFAGVFFVLIAYQFFGMVILVWSAMWR